MCITCQQWVTNIRTTKRIAKGVPLLLTHGNSRHLHLGRHLRQTAAVHNLITWQTPNLVPLPPRTVHWRLAIWSAICAHGLLLTYLHINPMATFRHEFCVCTATDTSAAQVPP
jgi:hypothetical protein